MKPLQYKPVNCNVCGMSYTANIPQDRRKHEKHHNAVLASYEETMAGYRNKDVTWFQPKIENFGVYQALNELNPKLLGFSYSGIDENDWESIQNGNSILPIGEGSGDGHDRYGTWISPAGIEFGYHANWRCGHIHFRPTGKIVAIPSSESNTKKSATQEDFPTMSDAEYNLRLALFRFKNGRDTTPSIDTMLRSLIVTPFDGNYGQAGVVITINGSPPKAVVLVMATPNTFRQNIKIYARTHKENFEYIPFQKYRGGVKHDLENAVIAYLSEQGLIGI